MSSTANSRVSTPRCLCRCGSRSCLARTSRPTSMLCAPSTRRTRRHFPSMPSRRSSRRRRQSIKRPRSSRESSSCSLKFPRTLTLDRSSRRWRGPERARRFARAALRQTHFRRPRRRSLHAALHRRRRALQGDRRASPSVARRVSAHVRGIAAERRDVRTSECLPRGGGHRAGIE